MENIRAYCRQTYKKQSLSAPPLPYAGRIFDEDEPVALIDSALEFWLTGGRYTDAFEHSLSEYLGVSHCSFVNSGSSANLLAFMALTDQSLGERAIRRGDEVITVACGFPTTVARFFLEALRAMSFPLRNAFIVSQRFGYVVAHFSFFDSNSLLFPSSLTSLSFHILVLVKVFHPLYTLGTGSRQSRVP